MAIYSSVPPPTSPSATLPTTAPIHPIDIPTWTATSHLFIPLEDEVEVRAKKAAVKGGGVAKVQKDSMKQRDALLKGKEGSRRRQRWENDNLLNNPHIQPPLPSDWAPSATHRVCHVPYYLAPLWDAGIAHRASERASATSPSSIHAKRAGITEEKGRVPADLKIKLKKAKGAKTLLQELEGEVRSFLKEYECAERMREAKLNGKAGNAAGDGDSDAEVLLDSDDEEIVFIGRDKDGHGITMSDEVKDVVEEELRREKIIYASLEGSREGGFARWLVHSLAAYYGLVSWSETMDGEEALRGRGGKGMGMGRKRVALVGVKGKVGVAEELPRPLWGMV